MALSVAPADAVLLDDALSEELLRLTDGAAAPCFQCGACTATCPWGLVSGEGLSVRKLMRRAQLGLAHENGAVWLCTTCAACEARCPRGVPISRVMVALRQAAWQHRHVPAGLNALMWGMYWDGNPWGRPPSQRSIWARGLEVPAFGPTSEILYYVGCTASYDQRMQKIARALAGIFRAAGVEYGTLGDREPCCGEAAHNLGQAGYVRQVVAANERLFAEAGVGTIVALSPHCYDMFRNRYFLDGHPGGWRPLHYSEYLAELIAAGRLTFEQPLAMRVTYHDPCYLGRRNGLYEAPREVLRAIPGLELVEMEESRAEALCCGGGGGRMWQETAAGQRFADLRVAQARATGAEVLVTTCPHCIACLEDSAKLGGGAPLRVVDVAEVVAAALGVSTARPAAREMAR
ncbi:MAG: 4Fe-4S dicluster domain-containing protein [Chloroflexi bacterium]|nr:4Fe-4S dicluster domain-containing protein [Chloroflexota bacterium]